MEATEARYDELVKTGKWKPTTPKADPNLIALTATIKSLQDSLQANKGGAKANGGNSSGRQSRGSQSSWKYDPALGTDGKYSCQVEGKDAKAYKWCTGPGHGRKPMWVCGHEPGKCDENYNHNSGSGASQGGGATSGSSSSNTTDPNDSIQALRAVLENADFSDDSSAQIQACLALLQR
jgi:hypothetical protein